ncbi:MAG: KilA-N domain-containing protein [Lewinella sp.]|nr:KilA-N domain-containing protein [Lewinella sp.]
MAKKTDLVIYDTEVKYDQVNDYVCLNDIASMKSDDRFYIADWLRTITTLAFIEEWEKSSNPNFNLEEFIQLRGRAGTGSFRVSVQQLTDLGCTGIYAKRGRNGGTYASIEWAIHFANWLDPRFYLATLRSYLSMQKSLYGNYAAHKRFARELAAENHRLPTTQAVTGLPPEADIMVERRLASVEADLINLALWGMTAREWRIRFPPEDHKHNMRDYATPEELKTLSALLVLSQELQQQGYTSEERLDRLKNRAQDLINHYCKTDTKQDQLALAQHKRGWGNFQF